MLPKTTKSIVFSWRVLMFSGELQGSIVTIKKSRDINDGRAPFPDNKANAPVGNVKGLSQRLGGKM
jgi:hypothetical protein